MARITRRVDHRLRDSRVEPVSEADEFDAADTADTAPLTDVWRVDQLDDERATAAACERVWRAYTRAG